MKQFPTFARPRILSPTLRLGALCLLFAPIFGWAQDTAALIVGGSSISDNVANDSMGRALASAVNAKFTPSGFETDEESESGGGAFVTDEILLAQVELPQMIAQNQGTPSPNQILRNRI